MSTVEANKNTNEVSPVQLGRLHVAQAVWVGAGQQQDVGLRKDGARLATARVRTLIIIILIIILY